MCAVEGVPGDTRSKVPHYHPIPSSPSIPIQPPTPRYSLPHPSPPEEAYEAVAREEGEEYIRALGREEEWKTALRGVTSPGGRPMFGILGFERKERDRNGKRVTVDRMREGLETLWSLFGELQTAKESEKDIHIRMEAKIRVTRVPCGKGGMYSWKSLMRGANAVVPILGELVVGPGIQGVQWGSGVIELALALWHFRTHLEQREKHALNGAHEDLVEDERSISLIDTAQTQTHDVKFNKILRIILGLYPNFLPILLNGLISIDHFHTLYSFRRFFK
ncbi:hypothetical protein HDV00_008946 [Rhizophlyctis rosea]|nr:hypothetical protein HDV00_008946 [Rhizophlyctis rosea]